MVRRPNILLIMTDQHNPRIAGFAGNSWADTQALDTLAASGVVFRAAYCNAPLCVPSRMSLLTGKYAHRCSAWDNQSSIKAEHVTLPGWLAQHGYTTASAGKMHFRGADQMHGFQYRPYGDLVDSPVLTHQPDPPDTVDGRAQSHAVGRFPFAGVTAIPESMQADAVVTAESLAWLREYTSEANEQPWFFVASYYRPHFPLTAPGRYIRQAIAKNSPYPPLPSGYPETLHPHDRFIVDDFNLQQFDKSQLQQALRAYYASVSYVDDLIGDLMRGLRESGCLDNTIIIYTADHGEMAGEHGLWWKRTYYDASAGVPLIISLPDESQSVTLDVPVELVDLFPTICDWAGITHPPDLDGESLLPLIEGHSEQRRKTHVLSELLGGAPETQFRMLRDSRWKLVDFPDAPTRLFDMQNDPDEMTDLLEVDSGVEIPPALQVQLHRYPSWETLAEQRTNDRRRWGEYELIGHSAVQYRLKDGRVIDGDDHLYDATTLKHDT